MAKAPQYHGTWDASNPQALMSMSQVLSQDPRFHVTQGQGTEGQYQSADAISTQNALNWLQSVSPAEANDAFFKFTTGKDNPLASSFTQSAPGGPVNGTYEGSTEDPTGMYIMAALSAGFGAAIAPGAAAAGTAGAVEAGSGTAEAVSGLTGAGAGGGGAAVGTGATAAGATGAGTMDWWTELGLTPQDVGMSVNPFTTSPSMSDLTSGVLTDSGSTASSMQSIIDTVKNLPPGTQQVASQLINKVQGGDSSAIGDLVKLGIPLAAATGLLGGNANTGNNAANQAAQTSADMWNYYKQNYQPLESNLISQAQAAGSPEEFARARGAANADVTGAFDQARKQSLSRMQSYGINPGSPAFQSAAGSTDLAEGAAKAGALTQADINTRNLAYSKALDVVGLGRGIPAASASSAVNAANAQANTARTQQGINAANMTAAGYAVPALTRVANNWFGNTPSTASTPSTGPTGDLPPLAPPSTPDLQGFYGVGAQPYAKGGRVIDAERMPDGSYDASNVKSVLQRHGLHPSVAHRMAHGAAARHKGHITPHMRVFAGGGGVGRQGIEPQDESNMGMPNDVSDTSQPVNGVGTETSDSVPAVIDGQEPAALSKDEFVMNAEVGKMKGDEILKAINDAGLKKRQQHGLQPANDEVMDSNDVSANAGQQAYAGGGAVDPQTMNDNKVADAQGAPRADPKPAPVAQRSDQGVRPSAGGSGVKKSAMGATQKATYKALTGLASGGQVKPPKKTDEEWRREMSERSQSGGLPGNPYYDKLTPPPTPQRYAAAGLGGR